MALSALTALRAGHPFRMAQGTDRQTIDTSASPHGHSNGARRGDLFEGCRRLLLHKELRPRPFMNEEPIAYRRHIETQKTKHLEFVVLRAPNPPPAALPKV